ncbi:NAD-dependent epimerase/dehydratase family protein [Methanospirillum lacunae]|uniref:Epimerase n=1 Tax=Methanospirillum lacunae TaxID=668570 RepID=A0A2V2MRE1_9EURY|nr:NAD(P)-dependent oxidoreductase [Methanospirillum lacunae]PWR70702.1 epimerase [Methanospirillum lacunae]
MSKKKTILVTGATGFIGHHVVNELHNKGHNVIAFSRHQKKAELLSWWGKVKFVIADMQDPNLNIRELFGEPEILIHLAWAGLPNYHAMFHYEENLPASYHFIIKMVKSGVKQVLVAGTCLEYGMQYGKLSEETHTEPITSYGIAKDTLRKFLQIYQQNISFTLQWVRLFYTYGTGQNPNSLFAQLNSALDHKDDIFNMSGGEQLRDYLPVEEVAHRIALVAEHPECNGVINCCSGNPISIRRLVEEYILSHGSGLNLNLGYFPYQEYEPMAFWGEGKKIHNLLLKNDENFLREKK